MEGRGGRGREGEGVEGRETSGGRRWKVKEGDVRMEGCRCIFALHEIACLVMLLSSLETIAIYIYIYIYIFKCVHLVPGGPHAMCNHNWLIAVQHNEDNV